MKKLRLALLRALILVGPDHLLAVPWILAVGTWLIGLSAFFHYGYDWDPGDGDVFNVVVRLSRGMWIYGDWYKAQIINLYPPFFHAFFAILFKLNLQILPIGRMLNALLMIASSVLVMLFVHRQIPVHSVRRAFAWCAGLLQLSVWINYRAAVNFRPDPLILFLTLMTLYWAIYHSKHVMISALLSAACFFTKQSGVCPLIAVFLFYHRFAKEFFRSYLIYLTAFLILPTIALEIYSSGYFLKSTFWLPSQILGSTERLDWKHFFGLFNAYFGGKLIWLGPLFIAGIWSTFRHRFWGMIVLLVTLILDLKYNAVAARHIGAGSPYFWVCWNLFCIFATLGAWQISHFVYRASKGRIPQRTAAIPFCFFLAVSAYRDDLKSLFKDPGERLIPLAQNAGLMQDARIAELTQMDPHAKWISMRAPMSILNRSGGVLDHEMCTINGIASRLPKDHPIIKNYINALRSGEYRYYQTGQSYDCGEVPGASQALQECWRPAGEGLVTFYGLQLPVEFYRYEGKGPGCHSP